MATKNLTAFLYLGIFYFLVPLITLAQSASAPAKVAKDQYIIAVPKNLSASEVADLGEELNQQNLAVSAELNSQENIFLIEDIASASARQIGIILNDQIIPFSGSEVLCEQLYKKNLVTTCSADVVQEATLVPNDSRYNEQWGHKAGRGINSEPAWDISQGDGSVVVAVIDTGVDYNHQDLKDNIWINNNEIPGDGIDNDANGYTDDIHGINAITNSGDPMDDNNHGTHCAGIIGAKGNNSLGVAGVNWNVKIMALKFLNEFGGGFTSDAIKAIDYMIALKNKGVNLKVSNNSWGSTGYTKALQDAIERASNAGIIFVTAAGNSATNTDYRSFYPATYDLPNIISVAASSEYTAYANDPLPDAAYFSNYGTSTVDIAAPGESVLSTTIGNNYQSFSGTSMAAPFVAGALSLLASIEPTLSANQLLARLLNTATVNPAFENITANGRLLNLTNLTNNTLVPTPTPMPNCQYTVEEIPFAPDSALGTYSNKTTTEGYFNTATANLNFSFPFYGSNNNKISFSQSGLVYFGEQLPIANEYDNILRNLVYPPVNTISLFKSFTYVSEPLIDGIFTKEESNAFKIYWGVYDAFNIAAGKFQSWLTLYENGVIEEFIQFPNERLRQTINAHSLNGIRAVNAIDSITYAQNGFPSPLKMNLGLRFTPNGSACIPIDTNPGSGANPTTTTTTTSTTTSTTSSTSTTSTAPTTTTSITTSTTIFSFTTTTSTSTTTSSTTTTTTILPKKIQDSLTGVTLNISPASSKKITFSGNLTKISSNFNLSKIEIKIKCQYKRKSYNFKTKTNSSGAYRLTVKNSKLKTSSCVATSVVKKKKLNSQAVNFRSN